jgi:hypothetical protein
MKNPAATVVGFLLACVMAGAMAEDKVYKDGPVTNVSFIRIKPGKYDDYMRYLATSYKALMDEQKKAGMVLNYGIYNKQARSPQEANLILTITYKNMAVLDRSDDFDAIALKVMGAEAARNQKAIDRESMRELVGSELIREVILK